jgi:hypothetical protein
MIPDALGVQERPLPDGRIPRGKLTVVANKHHFPKLRGTRQKKRERLNFIKPETVSGWMRSAR